jgi:hypothetical protein
VRLTETNTLSLMNGGIWARRTSRRSPALLLLLYVVIFLFSVLTPEPGHVQGYGRESIPVFVEGDMDRALCDTVTIMPIDDPCGYFLPVIRQISHVSYSFYLAHPHRGPPSTRV